MGFLVPLAIFVCIAAVVIFGNWNSSQERKAALQLVERMIDKGQEVPPDLLVAIRSQRGRHVPQHDLRIGLIMLAMSGGFLLMALAQYRFSRLAEPYVNGNMVGAAAFPGLIGLVLIGFWFVNRKPPGHGLDS